MPRGDITKLAEAHAKSTKMTEYKPVTEGFPPGECLSTGCSILNLACSGSVVGGIRKGSLVHIIGDSDTGKSLLALTLLAEASINPDFKEYQLFKDDTEAADRFPIGAMFGKALSERILYPEEDGGGSFLIEDFYFGIHRQLKSTKGKLVYILDSMDGLESHAGMELFETNAELHEKGKTMKQSYGDGKANKNSQNLRKLKMAITKSGSILVIVSQTRDNIDPTTMAEKTHAGGRALKFNATLQMWLAPRGKITKTIRGEDFQIGTLARVRISKNHLIGKYLDFELPMYYGYGIDDEQCSLRWLCGAGSAEHWKLSKGVVTTRGEEGLEKTYNLVELVQEIRTNETLAFSFKRALQMAWDDLETQLRQPGRYGEQ